MPIREYRCQTCKKTFERIEPVQPMPKCCGFLRLIPSVAAMNCWKADRKFPNVSSNDNKTFETKRAYEQHLKDNHITELGVRAKSNRPRGKVLISVR